MWLYMSFAKFCSLLEQIGHFFALVGHMKDKYNGFVAPPPLHNPGDNLQEAEHMGHAMLHEKAQIAQIYCWMEASHEFSLMLDSYAGPE